MRYIGAAIDWLKPAAIDEDATPMNGLAACVAEVVLTLTTNWDCVVEPAGAVCALPQTFQSPAVRLMLVIFVAVPLVRDTPDP